MNFGYSKIHPGPNSIEAINNKALVYTATAEYNKAIECFNQSTDLNPSDANVWNYKGLAFHELGKYEDAIASYDKAIILRHNYIEAVNNRELPVNEIKKNQQEEQQQQQVGTNTTSNRIREILPPSPNMKKDDYTAIGQNAYKSGAPIGMHHQTGEPQSPAHASITKENVHSNIPMTPKAKGPLPSINTSPAYRASEDSRRFDTQEIKKPDSNLKIMIPVAAGVIGIVIAVVIFGSGMMHQQAQPSTSLPTPTPTVQYPQPHNIANAGIKVQNSILSYVNSFFTHVHTTSVNTPVNIALIPRQEIEYREQACK
jgi:hypothetical protein